MLGSLGSLSGLTLFDLNGSDELAGDGVVELNGVGVDDLDGVETIEDGALDAALSTANESLSVVSNSL